jgi:hypothetical protein
LDLDLVLVLDPELHHDHDHDHDRDRCACRQSTPAGPGAGPLRRAESSLRTDRLDPSAGDDVL